MIIVDIDPSAGFCPGVTKAITIADNQLTGNQDIYSLGELVHCPDEINRLEDKGLKIMSLEELDTVNNSKILIRAHGIAPNIQYKLQISNNEVIDATCKIVHHLQQKVKISSFRMQSNDGQIIIFGKRKHPEVEGLLGYINSKVVVVENSDDLSGIDLTKPMDVFAQTTVNVSDFEKFVNNLFAGLRDAEIDESNVQIFNTICGSIRMRVPNLKVFAREHDVVIFVSGEQSSNGAYLSSISKEENINTFKVSAEGQVKQEWFADAQKIGITGAASTPVWLLEKIAKEIKRIISNKPQ